MRSAIELWRRIGASSEIRTHTVQFLKLLSPTRLDYRRIVLEDQVGLEPTASVVLSQGGLPIAYRASYLLCAQSRTRTCNRAGLSRAALPTWRIWAKVVLGGLEPPVVTL